MTYQYGEPFHCVDGHRQQVVTFRHSVQQDGHEPEITVQVDGDTGNTSTQPTCHTYRLTADGWWSLNGDRITPEFSKWLDAQLAGPVAAT